MGVIYSIMLALILVLVTAVNGVHNIMDYGAVLNNTSTETCNLNSAAIEKAFDAAITSISDREVLIPVGNFYSMPIQATNASYINFTIDGTLWACSDNKNWPTTGNSVWDFMNFTDMDHFHHPRLRSHRWTGLHVVATRIRAEKPRWKAKFDKDATYAKLGDNWS